MLNSWLKWNAQMNLKSVYNEFMKLFFGKIEIGMWSIFPPKHQNRMFEIFSFCVFSLLKMKINIEVIIAYQAVSYQLPVPKYMYSYSDCPPTYSPIHPYSSNIIKNHSISIQQLALFWSAEFSAL